MTQARRRFRAARRGLTLVVSLLSAGWLHAAPGECSDSPGQYEKEGYAVRRIRIDAPLAWLAPVRRDLDAIIGRMALKERSAADPGLFTVAAFNHGFLDVQEGLGNLKVDRFSRLAIQFGWSGIEACDPADRSLEVVYHVYTAQLSPSLVSLFHSLAALGRTPVDDGATRALAAVNPQPFVGYDRTRNVFGGIRLAPAMAGPFRAALLELWGSSTSHLIRASLAGSHDFATGALHELEWRAGYLNSDLPSPELRLRQGFGHAQIFASTRPVAGNEFTARFGASFEGGNQQTDLATAPAGSLDFPSTGFFALKTYAGQSMRAGPVVLRNSYGFEVGKAGDGLATRYTKHIVDSAHSTRFLIGDHRPLSIDTRFSAGFLNAGHGAPVAERFFGGSVVRPFISGDSWNLPADPLIRSFPPNRLALYTPGGTGGDRFFSGSLTVAAPVWRIPLVPEEVLSDPQFSNLIDLQLGLAETSLASEYRSKAKDVVELARQVMDTVPPELATLARIAGTATPFAACQSDIRLVNTRIKAIGEKLADGAADLTSIRTIAAQPDTTPLKTSYLTKLQGSCGKAESTLTDGDANTFKSSLDKLADLQKKFRQDFQTAQDSPAAKAFADQATKDMIYPRRVIRELLHEVNLISVSPVAIFDAARSWQSGLPAGDVRYGGGGGLRLTIVNLDLTATYAWTIGRKPGEGAGALLFTFGVSNLFR
jgi:hypothetical protein